MEVEFLGTGTSTGVPQIGCKCEVCTSQNDKDKRLRTSIIVRTEGKNILIDCGPDFRAQMLNASSSKLDCALLTHSHYDHVGGMDDLRPYCKHDSFPIYCQRDVINDIKTRIPYCFREKLYPGVPTFHLNEIELEDFEIDGIKITPLKINHYKLQILGFKIGNFAYITDAKDIPQDTMSKLKGIDTMVINALRKAPHISHMSLSECMEVVKIIKPKNVYLTHISHDLGLHEEIERSLPENMHLAYDGEIINII